MPPNVALTGGLGRRAIGVLTKTVRVERMVGFLLADHDARQQNENNTARHAATTLPEAAKNKATLLPTTPHCAEATEKNIADPVSDTSRPTPLDVATTPPPWAA